MRPRRVYDWRASLAWAAAWLVGLSGGAASGQTTLFSDDFDGGGSGANWTLFSHAGDYTAGFAFDYSSRGIPSAPNSVGGTTIGLQFTVNNNDANPAKDAVSAYPNGQSFSGDYVLKFDMWMNYNGGVGGGPGSTEFATAGINHTGTQVNWADNLASDGFWFAVSGEGGDSADYRAYRGGTSLTVSAAGLAANSANHSDMFFQSLFPSPTYETQGTPGKHWVEVTISQNDGVIEWRLNGRLIAIRLDTTVTAGNLMLGYMDTFTSIANPAADNFVVFDNVRVEAPDCNGNGVPDEQDLSGGTSLDCNANEVADECENIGADDFDTDGDVDLVDFSAFADCFSAPGVAPSPTNPICVAACLSAFDGDASASIDLRDFARFQVDYTTGPIPPREAGAPTGSQFLAEVARVVQTQREQRILEELTGGNVPGFLRTFIPIEVIAVIGGTPRNATYYVMPDYLCIGLDRDFVRMPMTPLIAQPIADAFECLLTTRKMVNDIYTQATVKLAPSPISPDTTDITLATTYYRHHQRIEEQRVGQPLGALIGGIKKDVVVTPLLSSNPGKVAIYGWHQLNGQPIQPLYLGHGETYVDYSHGIRLVSQRMFVDGVEMSVVDVLADPDLHVLLSDEGVLLNPRY